MSAPDDALDPIVERAPDRETWVGIKQSDQEDREFDMAELQRLRAVVRGALSETVYVSDDGHKFCILCGDWVLDYDLCRSDCEIAPIRAALTEDAA